MFIDVLTQVIILFILILIGFALAKTKVLNDEWVRCMTDFVLMFVTPCVIVKSFFREFNKNHLNNLLISFLLGALLHAGFMILSIFLIKDKNESRRSVLRFGVVFSNCGFMALPLQQALIGSDGVFFGSSFIAMHNAFLWSFGLGMMSGDKKLLKPLKIITRPSIIAIFVGMIVFLFSIPIPKIIAEPINLISAVNTPIPMIIIGYHLAHSNFLKSFTDIKCIFTIFLRLLIFPAIVIPLMWVCGVKGSMLLSQAICAAAPVAANTTMLAAKYNRDTELSVNLVSLSTLLSLATMPAMITFAEKLAQL